MRAAYEVMAETLWTHALSRGYFSTEPNVWNAVALRVAKDDFAAFPAHDERVQVMKRSVGRLNCEVSCCGELQTAMEETWSLSQQPGTKTS